MLINLRANGEGDKLEKFEIKKLPIYIQKNLNNFKEWID